MAKKLPSDLLKDVSARLRAVQAELKLSDRAMGESVGVGRTVWGHWISEGNMPEESAMIRLCEDRHLTLDWIYRGIPDHVPLRLVIRLEARIAGLDPDVAPKDDMRRLAERLAVPYEASV